MIINERRLIKVWCRLDNRARYLDELMVNKNISDDMFKVWYLENERVCFLRYEIACACGFDGSDVLRDYIIRTKLVEWDETIGWII